MPVSCAFSVSPLINYRSPWTCLSYDYRGFSWFALPRRPLHLLFGILEGRLVLFPHLFIFQPFIYTSVYSQIFIFFSGLQFNIFLIYFVAQFVPALTIGSFPRLDPDALSKGPNLLSFHFFFWALLKFSGTIRCSWLSLYFPCPCPRICHFSGELWFHFFGNWSLETKIWDPHLLVAPWVSLLRPSWWTKLVTVCEMLTLACTKSTFMGICVKTHEFMPMSSFIPSSVYHFCT